MWDVQWQIDGEMEQRENISVVQFLHFFFFENSDYLADKFHMLYLIMHVMCKLGLTDRKQSFTESISSLQHSSNHLPLNTLMEDFHIC